MANTTSISRYSEDWIPVKNIMNGMIELDNGQFVTGVKIESKDIFIMDQQTQNNVIMGMRNFYNMIDYEFWLVIADRPVDINLYLSQLQVLYSRTLDPAKRKLINQDINKANMFMSSELSVVDTEYYIMFKDKKQDVIQKRLHNIITGLANAGVNSAQASNSDLRMLLDNFLNGGVTTNFGTVMG
ncbi:MAG TPA: hypothetical protein OIM63_06260 [Bacilli bacterium]|nr:hypothetical protein [Bacilli bacterium]HJJ17664.1 hypothetical protein [Bacilli bacterium]